LSIFKKQAVYKLSYFTEENESIVFEFMQRHPFALITGFGDHFPVATHVPLDIKIISGKIVLTGHIMKNTDHHKAFLQNENVLVIFTGPQCYVSASWYVTKNVASTWNYMDVHAKGKIKFTNEEGTKKIIEELTGKFENETSAAAFSKLPSDYVDRLLKAIIGFTIEVEALDNVFKLSQNHVHQTRENIIEHLKANADADSHLIADEMKERL
jgi:transcriptional regulator